MTPEPGQKIGPYKILGEVGSGGMGLVYRAWDERLHREVAIKLLHGEYSMPGMRERFLREARVASGLNNPHICTIFDIGDKDGDPYLVMELLQGETLRDRISHGPFTPEEIVRYSREVAEALGAAHAKGIVHRDIKPANIFLVARPKGPPQTKILDFGLAKALSTDSREQKLHQSQHLTTIGATVGTVAYMSPEQARGEVLDGRSDLFSLGAVMYEMATLQTPFRGATSAMVFVQLLGHAPTPVRDHNMDIPSDLERVILRLLEKRCEDRYQAAEELVEALEHLKLSGERATMPITPPRVPPAFREDRRPSREPLSRDEVSREIKSLTNPVERRPSGSSAIRSAVPPARTPSRGPWDQDERDQRGLASQERAAEKPQEPVFIKPVQRILESDANRTAVRGEQSTLREPLVPRQSSRAPEPHAELIHPPAETRSGQVSVPRFEEDTEAEGPKKSGGGLKWALVALVLAAVGAGGYFATRGGHHSSAVVGDTTLLLTAIDNNTGDNSLDGALIQGLQMQLQQSPAMRIIGAEQMRSGLSVLGVNDLGGEAGAQKLAQRMGATAFIYGQVNGQQPYTVSIGLYRTATNEKLSSIDQATSKSQMGPTIATFAAAARYALGESNDDVSKTNVSLEQEGASSVDALHSYAMGEEALAQGRSGEALTSFRAAVQAEPKFVAAQIRLADAYRSQRAEVAAAAAATAAQNASTDSSDRLKLFAQFAYAMDALGDYTKATSVIRQLLTMYPADTEAQSDLALVLRKQGKLNEAEKAAGDAFEKGPYSPQVFRQQEMSVLSSGRFEGVLHIEEQESSRVMKHPGIELLGAWMEEMREAQPSGGHPDQQSGLHVLESQRQALRAVLAQLQGAPTQLMEEAVYLDNTGHMSEGLVRWQALATRAQGDATLASSTASLLAQAAMNRALTTSDCGTAMQLVQKANALEKGPTALFQIGLASALCGQTATANASIQKLQSDFSQATAVNGYYVPDIQAAIALHSGNPTGALTALGPAGPFDLISPSGYLRGLAHIANGQYAVAIGDFQTSLELQHRGAAVASGSNLYPMAQIGLARAYSLSGDRGGNTATAYKTFLDLWEGGDAGHPMMSEARSKCSCR